MITPTPPTHSQPFHHVAPVARIVLFAALAFGIAAPAAVLVWQAATPRVAVRSGDAGQFISATGTQGFLQPALTNVETTQGSVIVHGLFSAPHGQVLEVAQLNNQRGTYLCAVAHLDTCLLLAGPWAGTMAPVPNPNRVFDFERYGLANSNLWAWVGLGVLLSLLAGAVWFAAWAAKVNARSDDQDEGNVDA